jgi:hypothetical protein
MNRKYIVVLISFLLVVGAVFIFKPFSSGSAGNVSNNGETVKAILSEENDFILSSDSYDPESVVMISDFEKGEESDWQGNGVFDEKIYYEGSRSLGLISTNRKNSTVILDKKLDLSKVEYIEFMLNVEDKDAFESINLDFGDKDMKNAYHYSFTNLNNGWQLINIPKRNLILSGENFTWADIEKISFSILSRPNSILYVRLDALKGIGKSNNLISDWNVIDGTGESFFSLNKKDGKIKLVARNIGTSVAALSDLNNPKNFIFSASISPQSSGRSGLFIRGNHDNGYGYYFLIGGEGRDNWMIFKKNKDGSSPKEEMVQGSYGINFSENKEYWLRVDANGDKMKFYISRDGEEYEKLGEFSDSEFKSGDVGITALDGTLSLFDNFRFKKL